MLFLHEFVWPPHAPVRVKPPNLFSPIPESPRVFAIPAKPLFQPPSMLPAIDVSEPIHPPPVGAEVPASASPINAAAPGVFLARFPKDESSSCSLINFRMPPVADRPASSTMPRWLAIVEMNSSIGDFSWHGGIVDSRRDHNSRELHEQLHVRFKQPPKNKPESQKRLGLYYMNL